MASTQTELVCPLCTKPNNCGASREQPCWCMSKEFPAELVEQAGVKTANQCICLGCLKKHQALLSP